MLAYIPAPWILWVLGSVFYIWLVKDPVISMWIPVSVRSLRLPHSLTGTSQMTSRPDSTARLRPSLMQDMIPQPLGKTTFSNQHFFKARERRKAGVAFGQSNISGKTIFWLGKSVDTLLYCMGFCCEYARWPEDILRLLRGHVAFVGMR